MAIYFPVRGRATGLTGRRRECDVLDQLIGAVRTGESRALVVGGEPGAGKTALLGYAAGRASGCRVARAAGVQSEMELAFAGWQLCAPMLGHVDRLPVPQRDALRTAFGLSAGPAPDRFLVGLAVLSLLSDAARSSRWSAWWMTSSGLMAPPRRFWGSWRAAWRRSRPVWSSRPAFRTPGWRDCRSWRRGACGRPRRGCCWTRCWPGRWTSGSATGSWPRRGATRWRCWSCPEG